jgi:MscS family membrane protein
MNPSEAAVTGQELTGSMDFSLIAQNGPTQIGLFVGGIFATFVLSKVVQLVFRNYLKSFAENSKTKLDDILLMALEKPIYYILIAAGFQAATYALRLPEVIHGFVGNIVTIVVIVFVAWTVTKLVSAVRVVYIDEWTEMSESKLDDQVVPIVENTLKASTWAFAVLMIFSNMGYDLMSVITGLGIGGLAMAMAAKDTLSNVFGSVTIFADQPFQVDDVVTMAGYTGTVRDVGLRTCRLETFDGTLVTVPNATMVGGVVENVSARSARKFAGTIGLVYETSGEDLESAIRSIKAILEAEEHIREGYAVRFVNFGDSALEISVVFWVAPPSEYFDTVHSVNMAIKKAFDENKWDMAFPSQTLYLADPVPVAAK